MNTSLRCGLFKATTLVVATWIAAACASTTTPPTNPAAPAAEGPDLAELEAIYRARTDSALLNVHDADADFMTGMIGHHAQALVMSGHAPSNGASPAIRTLAARIINAQKDEISVMQRWLRDRGREAPEVHGEGTQVMIHGPDHIHHMPGMLTAEQLEELAAARGPDFDRLFLTYMIQHHEGAVTMVHDLFATDGAAQDDLVFKLASDIQVDQTTEVARMKLMLEEMTGREPR
ncbi:MAG: DUF305 domain-containing protein [Gemmatimonadetes bacterium]|nr:DUF305 domain-containing protein [Gemmatimonadota bacterium]